MTVCILTGDCREMLATLPEASVQMCCTSPPYFGLRDYGHDGQIGLEPTPDAYVAEMVAVFREVRRVLRDDGVLFLNIGDSYANDGKWGGSSGGKHVKALHGSTSIGRRKITTGLKPKDLIGIPWMLAFALRADGWYLRQEIIWHKKNPMPESVGDRCTKAHEQVFLLTKSPRYFWDAAAIAEPADMTSGATATRLKGMRERQGPKSAGDGSKILTTTASDPTVRNRRSVWTIASQPFSGAHFATMPPDLAEICIKAGSKLGEMVLDPFGGAGTTGLVADRLGRDATLIELNPAYAAIARDRINGEAGLFAPVAAE